MRPRLSLPMVLLTGCIALAACGGGSSGGSYDPAATPLSIVAPGIQLTIAQSSYAPDSAEHGSWTLLQQARMQCGFGALTQDTRLDAAARSHARYLTSVSTASGESILSHHETETRDPYYSGYNPWDRTVYQGYGDQVAEILEATTWDYDAGNPPVFPALSARGASSMLSLLNTVYHLTGALFEGTEVGLGASLSTSSAGEQRREEYRFGALIGFQTQRVTLGWGRLATYPCEGLANVPTTFIPANETPNPFPEMTDISQTMGPPIYLKVDRGSVLRLSAASISQGSSSVPVRLLTHATDPWSVLEPHEVFVVPRMPLQADASYQVSLRGTIDGLAFSRSFTLRTGR